MAVNSPHNTLSFVIFHVSVSMSTSINMAMKYLRVHPRFFSLLVEIITGPVTSTIMPMNVFMINTWVKNFDIKHNSH